VHGVISRDWYYVPHVTTINRNTTTAMLLCFSFYGE
jgi:hypothetical protein